MITRGLFNLWRAVFARDVQVKYTARFQLLDGVSRRLGFHLYNRNLYWIKDREFIDSWRQFPGRTEGVKDRRYILHSFAKALSRLQGDTVECGVFDGASSFLICLANEAKDKTHHIFDSFQGLIRTKN